VSHEVSGAEDRDGGERPACHSLPRKSLRVHTALAAPASEFRVRRQDIRRGECCRKRRRIRKSIGGKLLQRSMHSRFDLRPHRFAKLREWSRLLGENTRDDRLCVRTGERRLAANISYVIAPSA
jgi:hypothetical protein